MKTPKIYLNDILEINGDSFLVCRGLDKKNKSKLESNSEYDGLVYEIEIISNGRANKNKGVFSLLNTDLSE